jgi:hypothetical protein
MQFVLAVMVAAIFIVDWPLESEDLGRRFYQVALAFGIVAFVIGVGVALFPLVEGSQGGVLRGANGLESQLRERSILVGSSGLGLTFIGLRIWASKPTLSLPLLLACGFLLLLSTTPDTTSITLIYGLGTGDEAGRDAIYALVLGAGAAGLILYGYSEWERQRPDDEDAEVETGGRLTP